MDLSQLSKRFDEHDQHDRERFADIQQTLRDMKDNHLAHIQTAMESLASDMKINTLDTTEAKTNIKWLMGIGGAVGSILLTALVGLWFKQ